MSYCKSAKIYRLVSDESPRIYIGSTTQTLKQRLSGHMSTARLKPNKLPVYAIMNQVGFDKWRIELIKEISCETKSELESCEFEEMSKIDSDLLMNIIRSEEDKLNQIRQNGNNFFKGGSIRMQLNRNRYVFRWYQDRKSKSKCFTFSKYGGQEGALAEAKDFQAKIFPELFTPNIEDINEQLINNNNDLELQLKNLELTERNKSLRQQIADKLALQKAN